MQKIEINCDMGESYGAFTIGKDELLMPFVDACNIACGYHGGDPLIIDRTVRLAVDAQKKIGAHPSYPDIVGFGRRKMNLSADELKACVKYQVSALKGIVESYGGQLSYVKPHGALYNTIAYDMREASCVIDAILSLDDQLAFMGLAGSPLAQLCAQKGVSFVAEAFGDRRYLSDGSLMGRMEPGAVIISPIEAAKQVMNIGRHGKVVSDSGESISIKADSICVHGDNESALEILKAIGDVVQ